MEFKFFNTADGYELDKEEVVELREMWLSLWEVVDDNLDRDTYVSITEDNAKLFVESILSGDIDVIVAESEEGEVAGMVTFSERDRPLETNFDIVDIIDTYVRGKYRGNELAKKISNRLYEYCKEEEIGMIRGVIPKYDKRIRHIKKTLGMRFPVEGYVWEVE